MKNKLITSSLWLALIFVTNAITTVAYNYIYFPLIDPSDLSIEYGSPIPDLLLLVIYVIIYVIAGIIIAWRMKGVSLALVLAIILGAVGLAIELALRIPWFQLMPSHPSSYDHALAFIGSLTPPLSAGLGAFLYTRFVCKK